MTNVDTMLKVLASDPGDDTAWLALADCLAEQNEEERGELVRLQCMIRRQFNDAARPTWEHRLRELMAAGVSPCLPTLQGPAGIQFTLIPPGTFRMGAREDERWMDEDELPQRRVTITRGFWMSTTPITNSQWTMLKKVRPVSPRLRDHPAIQKTHGRCRSFCVKLGQMLKRGCRMPTEAEWEYACRAGTETLFSSGDDVDDLKHVGWCSYDGEWDGAKETRPVATFQPNAFGLYDMHGNVWEWCQDWYHDAYYEYSPRIDPTGPKNGQLRVVRGGSWRGGPWFCRSAERRAIAPNARDVNVGFRVVLELS